MRIKLKSVKIKNFLSYGYAEINLTDAGYCKVTGINNYKKDCAESNGSGKSSWSSAINWAITGETISGISSNVKNINVDEDICYVCLELEVDNNNFVITRYKNPKSNLSIIYNGTDISGKGVKESEIILKNLLPDLSLNLISSIIILGQGLPQKFTNNTPSGRKEVLEKLSKSDFMVEDLKDKITRRFDELNSKLILCGKNQAANESLKELLLSQLQQKKCALEELEKPIFYDQELEELQKKQIQISKLISDSENTLSDISAKYLSQTKILEDLLSNKEKDAMNENSEFFSCQQQYSSKKGELIGKINFLKENIKNKKNISDICPTCGQKIPGVVKPNVEAEESELELMYSQKDSLEKKFLIFSEQHKEILENINKNYDSDISSCRFQLKTLKDKEFLYKEDLKKKNQEYNSLKNKTDLLQLEKSNRENNIKKLLLDIEQQESSIKNLEEKILYIYNDTEDLKSRLSVVNQMLTLTKRDFRGFLLNDVISYIAKKSKEYSLEIFGSDDFRFELSGNNIVIEFCKKPFENLSGGEKKKVDLIIQLAIRDMMQKQLGFSCNVLILDEIFDELDSLGCNKVLELLSDKLPDIESLYIISHRSSELEIPYDSELIITKNEMGVSSVLCQWVHRNQKH